MNGRDWLIHSESDVLRRFDRLFIARKVNDTEYEVIVGFTEDGITVTEREPVDVVVPAFRGFALPRGVLEAIAEHVKPGPGHRELARMEEALKIERERVDSLLARMTRVRP